MNFLLRIAPLIALITSTISIVIGAAYPNYTHRWVMFGLWFPPALIALWATILPNAQESADPPREQSVSRFELRLHYCLLGLLCLVYFLWLSSYPFSAIHDEIRDGALRGQEIALGLRQKIFGVDWSQGLLFATLSSLLYQWLGQSVLIYRILGAVAGALVPLLLYFGLYRFTGRRFALFAAIGAATNSVELFFARTQGLIAFSSLLTVAAFVIAIRFWNARGAQLVRLAAPAGLLAGFALSMHASARAPVALILLGGWVGAFYRRRHESPVSDFVKIAVRTLLFTAVALGPQIFEADSVLQLASYRLRAAPAFAEILPRYWNSFSVLFGQRLQTHFYGEHLFPMDVSALILPAMLWAFFSRNFAACLALLCLVVLPITNSMILEAPNQSQRIVPLVPCVAVLLAGFLDQALKLKRFSLGLLFCSLLLGLRGYESVRFFVAHRATSYISAEVRRPMLFSLRHLAEYVKTAPHWRDRNMLWISVAANSALYQELQPLHITEFFLFFMRGIKVSVKPDFNIPENMLYISDRHYRRYDPDMMRLLDFCPHAGYFACSEKSFPIYEDLWVSRDPANPGT